MTTEEAKSFLRDLSDFGVPVILFSGGEPLLREDIFELAHFARELGIRPVLSTNGTLITDEMMEKISRVGFGEVGISIDGIGDRNDRFRGCKGAFDAALQGIRNCVALGQRVSLRFTISRHNYQDLPAVFELIERENVDRACFYHLAYTGRAHNMVKEDLSHEETRDVVDLICAHTLDLHNRGLEKEVLTVGNHADSVYLYRKVEQGQPERAAEVLELLRWNGGNNSGIRIGAVDNLGNVHPDQFWWHYSVDNVKRRRFGDIWLDTSDPLMRGLKDRRGLLKGRCSKCQYIDICGGNLRIRAEAIYGDVWAEDPACYLTDEEIGLTGNREK
jgi:radical SAM protein with 4Fe4S-binding SPASM domain